MADDKQKLLMIMRSLESDYRAGRISPEKYRYFRTKYEDKLASLDNAEATDRIRSMQGKPHNHEKVRLQKPTHDNKQEERDLVQKYIINPKKGDKDLNKKDKKPMDSGTFKLLAVLVLVIGFTCGIGFGVFAFDFGDFSLSQSSAIVEDTAFPDIKEVPVVNTTNTTSNDDNNYEDTSDEEVASEDTYTSSDNDEVASEDTYTSSDDSNYEDSNYDSSSGSNSEESGSDSDYNSHTDSGEQSIE